MSTSERYRNDYDEVSVYGNVMELIRQHHASEGNVVLDLGCGFGSIAEPVQDLGLTYIGLDSDHRSVKDLVDRGFEAAEVDLSDPSGLSARIGAQLNGRQLAAITALDFLEHISSGAELLEVLQRISLSSGRPALIVSIPNATHIDIAAKLLIGRFDYRPTGLLDETHVVFYSPAHLRNVMTQAGWAEVARKDYELSQSDQKFPADAAVLAPGTPIHRLLLQIREQASEGAIVNQFVRAYVPLEQLSRVEAEAEEPEESPFLSILVRTQGKRMSTFLETLLSLAAQTVQDFEVLVLAHDMTSEAIAELRNTVEWFDLEFTRRVRVVRVEGGGRARPLNVGVSEARGSYVAALDDDDVAFANWVEEFQRSASARPGSAIRTLVAEQPIESVPWGVRAGYTARKSTNIPFPDPFDLWQHMFENWSPFCGFAFPLSAFTVMGVQFDETLPVVEDWDVILQVALLCGVVDNANVTSLYRRWEGNESSLSQHRADEWHRARDKVLARIDSRTIPLPPGALSDFHRLYDEVRNRREWMDHLIFERNAARDESSQRAEKITELYALLHTATIERDVAVAQSERTQQEVERMSETISWKLTRPVRGLKSGVGRLQGRDPSSS
jgi:glycosyltransferase involved in cell wall biosynthesis/2-polyprenyl-3-methyl-5-hydroxy-6-metoxy-1,4-benzoquinol methylase